MGPVSPRWPRRWLNSALRWSALSVVEHVRPQAAVDAAWLRFLRTGLGVFALESFIALGYVLSKTSAPHRGALVAVIGAAVPITLIPLAQAARIVRSPWRATFTLVWTLLAGALLAACAVLDGGADSPLLDLSALPVIYAAVAMPFPAVAACSGAAVVEVGVVIATDPHLTAAPGRVLMTLGLLAGVVVLSLAVARRRVDLERRDAALVRELIELADTDGLTGCASQRVFHRALEAEISRAHRSGQPLSLAIVDVDLLKSINDAFGHAAGDAVLTQVGSRLREHCRVGDTAARIGGDEFAVIFPGADSKQAAAIAQRIAEGVRRDAPYGATLSIGVAELSAGNSEVNQLFRAADEALYVAKARGRSRVEMARSGVIDARVGEIPRQQIPEDVSAPKR
ncbi:MAG TPA: GGDEF domain-containing protein [Mycobacteriales bacterium]|nr:GGDEF domain-containing protein [Mycobacteriales bacterium]